MVSVCRYQSERASFGIGGVQGRQILVYVNELLPQGLTNQAEIFCAGSGRAGERLMKISADSVDK